MRKSEHRLTKKLMLNSETVTSHRARVRVLPTAAMSYRIG